MFKSLNSSRSGPVEVSFCEKLYFHLLQRHCAGAREQEQVRSLPSSGSLLQMPEAIATELLQNHEWELHPGLMWMAGAQPHMSHNLFPAVMHQPETRSCVFLLVAYSASVRYRAGVVRVNWFPAEPPTRILL